MTDVVVDRVRIRGTGARRLARVAARTLPGALDRALADLADCALDRLEIRLELDPADYDDETLALLWADRIRSAALATGAGVRSVGPAVRDAGSEVTPTSTAADAPPAAPSRQEQGEVAEDVVAAVRAWLDADAPATAVPRCVTLLTVPSLADAVVDRLGHDRARDLVRALDQVTTRLPSRSSARPGDEVDAGDEERPGRAPTADHRGAPGPLPPDRPVGADQQQPVRDQVVADAAVLSPHLELTAAAAADDVATADLTGATVAAGLVLCHPWLADLCRDAERHHPRTDPVHVRRAVLAVLAGGPEHPPDLVDDPVVRFLAGAPEDAPSSSSFAPLDTEPLSDLADAVLGRLAALLRGFERSSPTFVRTSWLSRPGVLELHRDPPRLLAAPLPLDVVLHLLPYPVSLLRLPWTTPLTVRFLP